MEDSIMRAQVTAAYPSQVWAQKVKKMKQSQLYAVWIRLKRQGRIN